MKILVIGPAYSISGYGERTRQLIYDLQKLSYSVDIQSSSWGNTINDEFTFDCGAYNPNQTYDVVFYVGMLDEVPLPPINTKKYIAVTAGIETDTMYAFSNTADLILVSSEHSKSLIPESKVLPESINGFAKRDSKTIEQKRILISGAWIGGQTIGEDRKNIPYSVYKLLEIIGQSADPSCYEIVLHTSMGTYSELERYEITNFITHLKDKTQTPVRIEFHHGILTHTELTNLYHSCQYMFTLTHGEGFGRHIAEFMATGGRIIAPNYSGYLDFANTPDNIMLPVNLVNIPTSMINKWLLKESKWAEVEDTAFKELNLDNLDYSISETNILSIEENNKKSLSILSEILII